jgi:hypothetical protein
VYELKLILSFTRAPTLWVCGGIWGWVGVGLGCGHFIQCTPTLTHPSGLYSMTVAGNFEDLLYINLYERKLECVSNKTIATPCILGQEETNDEYDQMRPSRR